jgi:hypothetical protein
MADNVQPLSFELLKKGELGLTPAYGSFLAEAAAYCLHLKKHSTSVTLSLSGDLRSSRILQWSHVNEGHGRTYADLKEATEYGACGIALVVAIHLTGIGYVERSVKGTGIDYWLAEDSGKNGIFQRAARLEVSGIFDGDESKISTRLNKKLVQTKPSDKTLLPAYVAIVEFGSPETRFVKKNIPEGDL